MAKLDFHPVWDREVDEFERKRIETFAHSQELIAEEITPILYRGKYKKNGAIVATVLIGNGFKEACHLTDVTVNVFTSVGDLLAAEKFLPNLTIAAGAWQVWSFVFKKESMQLEGKPEEAGWRVEFAGWSDRY